MDYKSLLIKNIEIEGALRALMARPIPEAEDILDKLVDEFLAEYRAQAEPEPIIAVDDQPIAEEPVAEEPETEPMPEPEAVTELETVAEPETVADPEPEPDLPAPARLPLTINDQYKFARVMFGGSRQALADAVAKIEAMTSLPEAYDYLLNDLDLDVEDDEVKEFVALVASHFNS